MSRRKRPGPDDIIWIPGVTLPYSVEDMLRSDFSCRRCGKHVQMYLPKLSDVCLDRLAWLIFKFRSTRSWVAVADAPKWVREMRTISVLKHWGFVKPAPNYDPGKRTAGLWIPTRRGIRFMKGKLRVYEYAAVYLDTLRGWAAPKVRVGDVDGTFHYGEFITRGERYLEERAIGREKE